MLRLVWSVARELTRTAGQLVGFAVHGRRLGLLLFVVLGAAVAALALAVGVAAPLLIYPVL